MEYKYILCWECISVLYFPINDAFPLFLEMEPSEDFLFSLSHLVNRKQDEVKHNGETVINATVTLLLSSPLLQRRRRTFTNKPIRLLQSVMFRPTTTKGYTFSLLWNKSCIYRPDDGHKSESSGHLEVKKIKDVRDLFPSMFAFV